MGNNKSKSSQNPNIQPIKVFMGGLDASGKTSILYRLKINKKIDSIPTVGFNVQQINTNSQVKIQLWDVGRQFKLRKLQNHYYPSMKALIWIIDCTDQQRLKQSAKLFIQTINDVNFKKKPVLILANKQDLKSDFIKFVTTDEIIQYFNLIKLTENKTTWKIVKCSAQNGQGLNEVINWLSNLLIYQNLNNK